MEESASVGLVLGSLELGDDAGISESKNPVWLDRKLSTVHTLSISSRGVCRLANQIGSSWPLVDNDGDQDLYIGGSPHFLFQNEGVEPDSPEGRGSFRGFSVSPTAVSRKGVWKLSGAESWLLLCATGGDAHAHPPPRPRGPYGLRRRRR